MAGLHTTTGGRTAPGRFLDPAVLARIGHLDLVARGVVDGFVSGLHRALYLGVSTDFAEHRAYVPGDDVRRIDWRLFARTDRVHVKTYEAETNADLVIALDVSRSMDFGTVAPTKLDYARFLAASLAHLGARQRDRVGLAAFDRGLVRVVPPAAGRRDAVVAALEAVEPGGAGEIVPALDLLGAALRRRGIVVLISDLYAEPDDVAKALDALRARGHDIIALQILDPVERDLDLEDAQVLEDLETGERLPVLPRRVREEYRGLVRDHVAALAKACRERRIDHACFDTTMPLDHALYLYLTDRARLARVR